MKEQLMTTAIAMWQANGFDNISIAEICKECDVTKGSFYYHFASKERLLSEYFYLQSENKLQATAAQSLAEPSYIEKIWILMRSYTQVILDMGIDLTKALLRANVTNECALIPLNGGNAANSQSALLIYTACEAGQKCGEIRTDQPAKALIDAVTAALTGVLFYWAVTDPKQNLFAQQRKMLDLLLAVRPDQKQA